MNHRQFHAALAVFLMAVATAQAQEQSCKVKLEHPVKVGDEFDITASGTSNRTVKYKDPAFKSPDPVKVIAELEATEKVLNVEANTSLATKVELTIRKLTRSGDAIVPAGTVIIAESVAGAMQFTIDGEPVDADANEAMLLLVKLHSPNKPHSADEQFDTEKPRKVGDTWETDHALLANAWSGPGYTIDPGDITCRFKLTGIDAGATVATGPTLHLTATTVIKQIHGDWHNDSRINSGTTQSELAMVFPSDPQDHRGQFHQTVNSTLEMSEKGRDGSIVDYQYVIERDVKGAVAPKAAK